MSLRQRLFRFRVMLRYGSEVPAWTWQEGVQFMFAYGLHYGYPRCCIEAFCRDVVAGHAPVKLRPRNFPPAGSFDSRSDHIPCPACWRPAA